MQYGKDLVSVIVPVFNVEKYLREAVESVCAQTYLNWELLLVDDGSTDRSGEICDEYAQKDARIRVFHTANSGVSCARNAGIKNARGKWITFLDSDDYLNKVCLETLVKYSNGMDLVVYSTQNVPAGRLALLSEKVEYYSSLQDTQSNLDVFRSYFYSSVWNKLYLADKITTLFDSSLTLNEDWWFNVGYMKDCHGICVLPDVLNYHRISTENSLTKHFRANAVDDGRNAFYAQLQLMGHSQKAKSIVHENFVNMMMTQTVRLVNSKGYSLKEKKSILDSWANNEFWEDDALDLSSVQNKRYTLFLNFLKQKKTWISLLCCQLYAVFLNWKERSKRTSL